MTSSPYEELRRALEPVDWTEQAACADPQFNPDLWFAPKRNRDARETAKRICGRCPVRALCLADGKGEEGIWGGRIMSNVRRYRRPAIRVEV